MKNPSNIALEAMKGLNSDGRYYLVIKWLEECLAEQDIRNRSLLDVTELRQGQGVAKCLEMILRVNGDAKTRKA